MRQCIIVGNDRGGVGKDLVSELLWRSAQELDPSARLIEVETAPRLSRIIDAAEWIEVQHASHEEIYHNPDVVFSAMDALGERVLAGPPTVCCLGANLTSALLKWGESTGAAYLGAGENLLWVVPLTMNRASLASGLQALWSMGQLFPRARRLAVLNEAVAQFPAGDQNIARRLREARGEWGEIETVRLGRMSAPAWGYMQNIGSLQRISELSYKDLVNIGLPVGVSTRSLALFDQWLSEAESQMAAVLSHEEVSS
ncbi:hypothetical protein [Amorphus orientalis]|uniref:Uncharacterized protein n=1 Tax=Amorphus orientalis TaxID=649198 RepID=A0AAE3VMY4_9HYPH|nr:hypothetical protein [Amorphus orientalis]MDQ0314883.1 hypothetical protein [Amorphus orientalis]